MSPVIFLFYFVFCLFVYSFVPLPLIPLSPSKPAFLSATAVSLTFQFLSPAGLSPLLWGSVASLESELGFSLWNSLRERKDSISYSDVSQMSLENHFLTWHIALRLKPAYLSIRFVYMAMKSNNLSFKYKYYNNIYWKHNGYSTIYLSHIFGMFTI